MTRAEALAQLLAMPDPPDLPKRGRKYVLGGKPFQQERMRMEIERAYIRHRIMAAGIDESAVVSVRRGGRRVLVFGRRISA